MFGVRSLQPLPIRYITVSVLKDANGYSYDG